MEIIEQILKQDNDFLARFCDRDIEEVIDLKEQNELKSIVENVYSQMPKEELDAFLNEI